MPQVLQLRPHVDQFRPQQPFYRFAGIHPPLPKLDQFSDLAQREAESLHLLDEVKSLDGALSVQSEPTCAANRLGQELALLVESDRVYAQGRALRDLADLHRRALSLVIGRHDRIIQSGVQSRVKRSFDFSPTDRFV